MLSRNVARDCASAATSAASASSNDMCLQVNSVVEMLTSMVNAADSADDVKSNDLLQELAQQCKALHPQMVSLVESTMMSGSDDLGKVLQANDDLQTCLAMYEKACITGPPSCGASRSFA